MNVLSEYMGLWPSGQWPFHVPPIACKNYHLNLWHLEKKKNLEQMLLKANESIILVLCSIWDVASSFQYLCYNMNAIFKAKFNLFSLVNGTINIKLYGQIQYLLEITVEH